MCNRNYPVVPDLSWVTSNTDKIWLELWCWIEHLLSKYWSGIRTFSFCVQKFCFQNFYFSFFFLVRAMVWLRISNSMSLLFHHFSMWPGGGKVIYILCLERIWIPISLQQVNQGPGWFGVTYSAFDLYSETSLIQKKLCVHCPCLCLLFLYFLFLYVSCSWFILKENNYRLLKVQNNKMKSTL